MSSRAVGPNAARRVGAGWPRGRTIGVPLGDDGAGAAVVADRQVAPVRRQRVVVGAEHAADVARVVERGVEVDVVGDGERQVER